MPLIEAHLIEGYDADSKARLGHALTDAIRGVIPAAPEAVTVILREVPAGAWMRGGIARQPAPALPDPAGIVRRFLDAMEARDLVAAEAQLAPGFTMRFPGAPQMTALAELVAWSAPRYRFVRKTYAGVDTVPGDPAVVWCRGTLSGEWPDGTPFDGIRFVDRFEVAGGRLTRQDVWNDIAETRGQS